MPIHILIFLPRSLNILERSEFLSYQHLSENRDVQGEDAENGGGMPL